MLLEQELRVIYLLEMTKCLTSFFERAYLEIFKTGLLTVGQWWARNLLTLFLAIGHFAFVSEIMGEGKMKTLYIR